MIAGAVAAIFMYHHVSAQPPHGPYGRALTVAPQELDDQLRWLRAHACKAVTLDALVADVRGARLVSCEVALTFDDGYADAATQAAPLLRRYGDAGTFFIATGFIGAADHVRAAQVQALARDGMQIGAHTISHADLTLLGGAALREQVDVPRSALQRLTGQDVDAFAYPAGRYDASVESVVRGAGYRVAVSTTAGSITRAAVQRDVLALPRYRILHGSGVALMQRVLGGARTAGAPVLNDAALRTIARERIAGNAPDVAERVAVALLRGDFSEQVLKVRVFKAPPAVVAGIMLSGVKFHRPVDRQAFAADAADMFDRAFAADASIEEVDMWAVVPVAVAAHADVSGDFAVPTNRTVFSASLRRADWARAEGDLGTTYWEPGWLQGAPR